MQYQDETLHQCFTKTILTQRNSAKPVGTLAVTFPITTADPCRSSLPCMKRIRFLSRYWTVGSKNCGKLRTLNVSICEGCSLRNIWIKDMGAPLCAILGLHGWCRMHYFITRELNIA